MREESSAKVDIGILWVSKPIYASLSIFTSFHARVKPAFFMFGRVKMRRNINETSNSQRQINFSLLNLQI